MPFLDEGNESKIPDFVYFIMGGRRPEPPSDYDTETRPATALEIEPSNYPKVSDLRGKDVISRDICVFVRDLQYDNISGRYQFVTQLPDCPVLPKILP